ncbi:MAG: Transposase [Firmicutes bacterium ADurb.Bin193]|nr:MAG: Transposase [Firmicutes bacterium ADurb.Bin193]
MKRRKDGRFMKWFTVNGKRKPIYGYSPEEVEEKIDQIKFEQRMGLVVGDTTTVREWAQMWFKTTKEGKVSTSTENGYRNAINVHIIPHFKETPLREVRPIHVQALINSKEDTSASLQHSILITLKQMFETAIANGLITTNPADGIKNTGKPTEEKTPLTKTQIDQLLAAVKDTRAEVFVCLALYCGLRRGEILALEWKDINFENNTISVNKSLEFIGNSSKIKLPKTKAGHRIVPLPESVKVLLLSQNHNTERVVGNVKGKTVTKIAFRRMWDIVVEGLQKPIELEEGQKLTEKEKRDNMIFSVTPHVLRHTYCTTLYDAGIDLKTAQKIMGHSNISVTAQIYTHLDNSHIIAAGEKLNEFI